jgi:hypothetical protein
MTIIDHTDEAECFELMVEEPSPELQNEIERLQTHNEGVAEDLEGGPQQTPRLDRIMLTENSSFIKEPDNQNPLESVE